MKSTHLRFFTTLIVLFSFYGNLLAQPTNTVAPFDDSQPAQVAALEDPEYLDALDSLSEEDLQEEVIEQMIIAQTQACMGPDGNIPYNKTVQIDREGTDRDESINCNDVAAIQYQIMAADQDLTDRQAVSCVTSGWHAEDRLAFVRELELPVEEVLACPGKDTNSLKCMGEFVCGAYAGIAGMLPVGGPQLQNWMSGWARDTFDMNCSAGNTLNTLGNCLTEVVWGVIKNIVGNIEFLADGIRWVGDKISDAGSWVYRKLAFWEDDEHEDVSSDQQQLINSSTQIREQHSRQLNQAEEESTNAFTEFFSNIGGFLNRMIAEPAGRNFGCAKWEGNRFTNTTNLGLDSVMGNDDNSNAVRCEEPISSWECASCSQRAQLVCGVVGFLGGEAITTLLTGGALRVAGLAARATGVARVGSAVGQASLRVARSTARGLTTFAGRGFSLIKNTPLGSMAFKIGNKTVNVSSRLRGSLVGRYQSLRAARQAGKSADEIARELTLGQRAIQAKRVIFNNRLSPLSYAKDYFNLLDDAWALGAGGKTGLLAARAARTESQVRNSMTLATRAMPEGPLRAQVFNAQARVDDVLNRIKNLADEAKNSSTSAARKAEINSEMSNLSREFTSAKRGFEDAYAASRRRLTAERAQEAAEQLAQQQRAEAARLAAERARVAQEQARRTARNDQTSTALVLQNRSRNTNITSDSRAISPNSRRGLEPPRNQNAPTVPARRTGLRNQPQTIEARGMLEGFPETWRGLDATSPLSVTQKESAINGARNIFPDDANFRVVAYDRNGNRLLDINTPTAVNGRIEGFTNQTRTSASSGVDLSNVGQVDMLVTYTDDAGKVVNHRMPVNFQPITNPRARELVTRSKSNASMTTDELLEFGRELHALSPSEIRQVAAEATLGLQRGERMTLRQAAAYQKSFGGYINKETLANADVLRRAYESNDPLEIARIFNEGIVGNSPATQVIRESMITALQINTQFRVPTGALNASNMTLQAVQDATVESRLLPPANQQLLLESNTTGNALIPVVPPSSTGVVPPVSLGNTNRTVRSIADDADNVIYVTPEGVASRNLDDLNANRGSVGATLRAGLRGSDDTIFVSPNGTASRNLDDVSGAASRTRRVIAPTYGGRVIAAGTVVGAVANTLSDPQDNSLNGIVELNGNLCELKIRRGSRELSTDEVSALNVTVDWKQNPAATSITRCSGMSCELDLTDNADDITSTFTINGSVYMAQNNCSIIRVVAPLSGVYEIETVYSGSPPKCTANIDHSMRGDADAVRLTATNLESRNTTLKWFKSDSEDAAEQICSGSTTVCTFPSGVNKAYLKVYGVDDELIETAECKPPRTPNPNNDDIFDPYDDDDDSAGRNSTNADVQAQFYESQRSPPPSLFQSAPIPRRPTHYLHSGWY